MQRPDSNARLIVFDGICHVCAGGARLLRRLHMESPFKLIPMQSVAGRVILVEYGIDPDDPATFLMLDQGRQFIDSDAAIYVIGALGGAWRLCGAARMVPERWRDALYRLLARNRYRWFGRRSTCYLPL
jgi:predicted DCC family thiol-disulfide oxidoreductase YuxK